MKQAKNLPQATLTNILDLAVKDFNFYAKRTRDTRLATAEKLLREVGLISEIECADLVDWLLDSKPAPVAKKKPASTKKPLEPTINGELEHRDDLMTVLDGSVFIISSAQNNTAPHPFLKSLERLADHLDAKLLLMPIKYTTTLESLERKAPAYHKEVKPYLVDSNTWLSGRGMVRLAISANVLPTAKQPINTAANLNNGESLTIVASPKKQLKTLARPKDGSHRWVYTTGSCTQRHYTDTRAGDEGCNAHTFGAIVVNIIDGKIHHQEIVSDESGSFYYGNTLFTPDDSQLLESVPAVVLGDLHCEKMCPDSLARALEMIEVYKPDQVVLHDTLDFMSRNHHNRTSGRFLYQMGQRSVLDDLNDTVKIINEIAALTPQVFIVCSNHDLALDSWLDCPQYRPDHDPVNAKTYYFLKHAILDHIDIGADDLVMMELALNQLVDQLAQPLSENVIFGRLDLSHNIQGFECGSHGHQGNSGARGSQRAFKAYQMPWISGHTHSPARDGDVLTVGVTGSLEMGYNKGGTNWDRANAVIYPNKTAVLVPMYGIGENQF